MKKKPLRQKKEILDAKKIVPNNALEVVICECEKIGKTWSSIRRRVELLVDICKTNGLTIDCDSRILFLLEKYDKGNAYEKLRIRRGNKKSEEYRSALRHRSRSKVNSHFTIDYWLNKGYTEEEAKEMVSSVQSENAKKRTKESYENQALKLNFSKEYWLNKGYTEEEADVLREPYLAKCKNDLNSLITKYGFTVGIKKYSRRVAKYKKSMQHYHDNGYFDRNVSKESIRFFIPLYKKMRRLGFKREDVYWGIKGSKEFFIRRPGKKNGGIFVDFCVPSINLAIEYHGTFWHFKDEKSWKNPFIDVHRSLERDREVVSLCESRNIELLIIWSDEDKKESFKRCLSKVEEKMNGKS